MSVEMTSPEDVIKAVQALQSAEGNRDQQVADLVKSVQGMQQAMATQRASNWHRGDHLDAVDQYVERDPDVVKSIKGGQGKVHVKGSDAAVRMLSGENQNGDWEYGLLDDPNPQSDWQRALQEAVTSRSFIRASLRAAQPNAHVISTPRKDREVARLLRRAPDAVQRIFGDVTNFGAEWIDDTTVPTLLRDFEAQQRIGALFQSVTLPRGGDMKNPYLTGRLRPYIKSGATTDDPARYTASSIGTANKTFSTKSFAVRQQVDDEAVEDAFIAFESVAREALVAALVDGQDDALINGDTSATHQDTIASWNIRSRWGASGLGGAQDHRRSIDGLRKRAFDASSAVDLSGESNDAGLVHTTWKAMDAVHALGDTVFLMSLEHFVDKAVNYSDFRTWDKVGANATLLTGQFGLNGGPLPGQVGFLYGRPVILAWFLSADMNASGKYDNTTTDKTGILAVNTSRYRIFRKPTRGIETARDITRGVTDMVTTLRMGFDDIDNSTVKSVAFGYGIGS